MIEVNNKEIDVTVEKKTPQEEMVSEGYKYLRNKIKFPILLEYPKHLVKPDPENAGRRIMPAGRYIQTSANIHTSNGSEKVRYFQNKVMNDIGRFSYFPNRIDFTGHKTLDESEIDLAYFLLFCSSKCENGLKIKKNFDGKYLVDEVKNANASFRVVNKPQEATRNVSEHARKVEVEYTIFHKDSKLKESDLRTIAQAYGVPYADKHSLDEVRMDLFRSVSVSEKAKDKNGGYAKFMEMTSMNDNVQVRALIQKSVDSGLIAHDTKKKSWRFMENGEMGEIIVEINKGLKPIETLSEHLKAKTELHDFLKTKVTEKINSKKNDTQ